MCPFDVNANEREDKTEKKERKKEELDYSFIFFQFLNKNFKLLLRKIIISSMKPQDIHPLQKSLSNISTIAFNDPSLTSWLTTSLYGRNSNS